MKDDNIVVIRVIAMFLVIVFHSLCFYSSNIHWPFHGSCIAVYQTITAVLTYIHVPLFFIISGYLYELGAQKHPQSFVTLLRKKTKRLLFPYLVWAIIQFPLFSTMITWDTPLKGMFHLWFLLTLFWCFLASGLVKGLFNKTNKYRDYLLAIFALFLSQADYHIPNYFCLSSLCRYIIYFVAGIMIARYGILKKCAAYNYVYLLIGAAVGIGITISIILLHDFGRLIPLVMAASTCCLFLGLYMLISKLKIAPPNTLNKYSMGIYIIHHIIMWVILNNCTLNALLSEHYYLGPIILFLVGFIGAYALTGALHKNRNLKNII